MKGKRGGGPEDTLTIVFSILLYALILVFFSILMFSRGCNRYTENSMLSEENTQLRFNNFLWGYLRSNVTVDGRQSDIAGLIGMYMAEPAKYEVQLINETKKIINSTLGSCFRIQISVYPAYQDSRNLNIESDCLMTQARMTEIDISATQAIPLQKNLEGIAIINVTQRKFV
jgi:hypothetical protein